ncbi:MAG TPA: extracellular solute-binding protein [Candidatus Cybelea sp.]|nr:extracellular solute-binding protein [Candidatus Cybelea sp.]
MIARFAAALAFAAALQLAQAAPAVAGEPAPRHGLSIFGELKYPPAFAHFDYVNPDAPKGGDLHLWSLDSFDSLNPFILKAVPADGIDATFDSLMVQSMDEPDSAYGLIAKDAVFDAERHMLAFDLRPEARFHDGTPVTADDVVFSFETVVKDGNPRFRILFQGVAGAAADGRERVIFRFKPEATRDLPLLVATGVPIFSKAYFKGRDFNHTGLDPILSSGPYAVAKIDPGRSITYARVADYWAKDLPVNRGRYNFDHIRYDYYRDREIAFEAFFSGQYDFREEATARQWATGYDRPPVRAGLIKKEVLPDYTPSGVQSFFFNLRRAKFQDRRVREALSLAFDFEWENRTLFYGLYKRTRSMFENSELAATGLPSPEELKLLEPYRDRLPPELFMRQFDSPTTDGKTTIRDNLRTAQELLKQAGYEVRSDKLVNAKTGETLGIEFLLFEATFDRVVGPYVQNLKRLGIDARIRTVDITTFQRMQDNLDFDVVIRRFTQPLTPGVEQRAYWGSANADTPGTLNFGGIKDPIVDALVEKIVGATDRPSLIAACHALDRVLMWDYFTVPQWYSGTHKIAYWDKFDRPKVQARYTLGETDLWWYDAPKAKAIADGKAPAK